MRLHQTSITKQIRKYIPNPLRGAEVGTWKGETSAILLREFPVCRLLCVDLWQEWKPGSIYFDKHQTMGRLSASEWNIVYQEAVQNLEQSGGLFSILRMSSTEAAAFQPDESLDFVFLDASHYYEDVRLDILAWLPKVRPGGLVMGHDYEAKLDKRRVWGVKRAVTEVFGDQVEVKPGLVWSVVKEA